MVLLPSRWQGCSSETSWFDFGDPCRCDRTILGTSIFLLVQIWLPFSRWQGTAIDSNQGCPTIHILGRCENSFGTTRRVCLVDWLFIIYLDVPFDAALVLFLWRRYSMERNIHVSSHSRRYSILDALFGARCVSGFLSIIAQAASPIYQPPSLWCIQRKSARYHLHDYNSSLLHGALGAHLQCLDVHGLWIIVRMLVDANSFGIRLSMGSALSTIGIGYTRGSSRAPQNFQVQLRTLVHVVRSTRRNLPGSPTARTQTISTQCVKNECWCIWVHEIWASSRMDAIHAFYESCCENILLRERVVEASCCILSFYVKTYTIVREDQSSLIVPQVGHCVRY